MTDDLGTHILQDIALVYRQQRRLAEAAARQLDDEQFFHAPTPDANSVAVIMKHVGGNLRSRWTDFLTSDGEKPDRNRDGEFMVEGESRASVMQTWDDGFASLEGALSALTAADLARTVTIRGEPHTVVQALIRNLAHTSHHAGQVVHLAKMLTGSAWLTLSIPRGGSKQVLGNFWVAAR
ncbi:MAG TPA: DUF1572 family protein [Longimicrobiales bacterium]|nr:DUF1572 family protein [Longimicrobiales bacterium]